MINLIHSSLAVWLYSDSERNLSFWLQDRWKKCRVNITNMKNRLKINLITRIRQNVRIECSLLFPLHRIFTNREFPPLQLFPEFSRAHLAYFSIQLNFTIEENIRLSRFPFICLTQLDESIERIFHVVGTYRVWGNNIILRKVYFYENIIMCAEWSWNQ